MNFKEYKSSNYWQSLRTHGKTGAIVVRDLANIIASTVVFGLFPILFCIAVALDA